MYLQLAESAESEAENPYIYVPDPTGRTKGIRVREDLFDGLDDVDYYRMMKELAPFQREVQAGLSEGYYLADRASRRAKRAEKDAQQSEKKNLKNEKKKAKNDIKKARAEQKRAGGRGNGKVLDSVMSVLGGVIGTGGESPEDVYGPDSGPAPPPEKNNTPLYIGLGVGGVALAAIIYAATRSKGAA